MTLIGRGDKPRDCWLSADYHTSLSTGSAVKCRPEVRKSLALVQGRRLGLVVNEFRVTATLVSVGVFMRRYNSIVLSN